MLRSTFSSLREYLTPVNNKSDFASSGEISPDEFVRAGDFLTSRFPTWQWSPADNNRDFLPKDKQVLVTKRVPSARRAESYVVADATGADLNDGEWTLAGATAVKHEEVRELDDINDLMDQDDDDIAFVESSSTMRYYDLYIGYSTSYRVPKLFLVGYDANGVPLSASQMFEDIVPDYRDKTATIEKLPFINDVISVSIHPCRHANVMKVLMEKAMERAEKQKNVEDDEWESVDTGIRVDQYLVVFLKFIAGVTPGIEGDYTMES